MMELYESSIDGYAQLLALDMHTVYGPHYQMPLVNSTQEKMTYLETADRFGVPRAAAANPQEFYSIQGDMVEYLYTLMKTKYPGMPFYATSFEFGTFGDSLGTTPRAIRTTVFENRHYWNGGIQAAHEWISHEYEEMFAPSASDWFGKAVSDIRLAFEGILMAERYVD